MNGFKLIGCLIATMAWSGLVGLGIVYHTTRHAKWEDIGFSLGCCIFLMTACSNRTDLKPLRPLAFLVMAQLVLMGGDSCPFTTWLVVLASAVFSMLATTALWDLMVQPAKAEDNAALAASPSRS